MRKTITLLIALLTLTVSSWATVTQQQIGSFYYELDDENHTATLIKDPNAANEWQSYSVSGDLVISGTVNDGSADYTVTTIGEKAFINGNMSSIVIEEGVVNIAENAFLFCSNSLTKATLPSTIKSIGNYAFDGCSGLTKITINATTPPTFGDDVFNNASSLAHIYVPSANVSAYKGASGWSDHASIIEAAPVSVEWNQAKVSSVNVSCDYVSAPASQTVDGITVTATAPAEGDYARFNTNVGQYYTNTAISINNGGTITFAPASGKLKSIVIECGDNDNSSNLVAGSGWTWNSTGTYSGQLIWTSEEGASSVVLACSGASFSFNSITSAEFIFAAEEAASVDPTPAATTITWETTDLATLDLYMEGGKFIKDIVVMASYADVYNDNVHFNNSNGWPGFSMSNNGLLTFTPASGKLTSIVITCYAGEEYLVPESGWAWSEIQDGQGTLTWTSASEEGASSVVLKSNSSNSLASGPITSIVFTVKDAAAPVANSVTWTTPMVKSVDLYQNSGTAYAPLSVEMRDVTASISAGQSGAYAHFKTQGANTNISVHDGGTLTFTSATHEFARIVINFDSENDGVGYANYPTEWNSIESTLTWAATPTNSVVLEDALVSHITSIVFTYATAPEPDPMPSGPSFTWEQRQVNHVKMNCSNGETKTTPVIKNIITSLTRTSDGNCYFGEYGYGQFEIMNNCGTLTFQSIVGDLTGIIITCSTVYYANDLPAGWRYDSETGKLIWLGTPAETVTLSGDIKITISSIEFFYDPAPAPRLGKKINGCYEITGAHTAKVFAAAGSIPDYIEDNEVTYYITEIGDYAYYNDPTEGYFYFGANIAKVGAHAFEGCSRAIEFTFRSTVLDEIGDEAFKNCKLLGWLNFDTQMPPVLGSNAFSGDGFLNHINVYPEISVLNDYKNAAGWSTYADKITLSNPFPATVGEQFFFDNQNTTNIYAVSSVSPKEIKVMPYTAEVNALYPITRTGTLIIPEEASYLNTGFSVTGIGANAYKDSARFDVVMIPQAVKSIEAGAFLNCTGVENVFFLWNDPTTVTWYDGDKGLEFKTATNGGTKIFVPEGKLAAYQAWAPAWAGCMYEGKIEEVDATAGQDPDKTTRYYRTYFDSSYDLMMPPSVWAHVGYVRNNEFILRPIAFDGDIVPAGTAVVLESETPIYSLIKMDRAVPSYTGTNDLIGSDVAFPRAELGENADKVYVLGKSATIGTDCLIGMGLYRYTGTTLGAHKAYMVLENVPPVPGSGQQNAPIRFLFRHENTATGIENASANFGGSEKRLENGQLIIIKNGVRYNAQGQIVK